MILTEADPGFLAFTLRLACVLPPLVENRPALPV
jgi:hypothetical protein